MKAWIVPDVASPGEFVIIKNSRRPDDAIALAPLDDNGDPHDISLLTITWVPESFDEDTLEVFPGYHSVTYSGQDVAEHELKKGIIQDIEDQDSLLQPFKDKRADVPTQSRAIIKHIEGDSSMLNDMALAIRFAEFGEYKRSAQMGENKYYAIVDLGGDAFEIQEFPLNQRPSNLLAVAPQGILPGDEEFLTKRPDGGFDIDWDGRLAKFNALEYSAEDARKVSEWNNSSPIERIKNAFIRSDNE